MKKSKKPLESLPVAKGRARTRRCFACRRVKKLALFPPGGRRVCTACKNGGVQRLWTTQCVLCGESFRTASVRALYDSEVCKREAAAELARERRRQKKRRGQ